MTKNLRSKKQFLLHQNLPSSLTEGSIYQKLKTQATKDRKSKKVLDAVHQTLNYFNIHDCEVCAENLLKLRALRNVQNEWDKDDERIVVMVEMLNYLDSLLSSPPHK